MPLHSDQTYESCALSVMYFIQLSIIILLKTRASRWPASPL